MTGLLYVPQGLLTGAMGPGLGLITGAVAKAKVILNLVLKALCGVDKEVVFFCKL